MTQSTTVWAVLRGFYSPYSSTTCNHTVKLAGQVTHQLHWAIVQMSVGKLLFFNDDILKSNFYFLWEVIGFLGALLIYKF